MGMVDGIGKGEIKVFTIVFVAIGQMQVGLMMYNSNKILRNGNNVAKFAFRLYC